MVQGQERLRLEDGESIHQFSLEEARPREFLYFPPQTVIFLGDIGWDARVIRNEVFVSRLPTRRNDLSRWEALNDFETYFAGEHDFFVAGTVFRAYTRCLRQRTASAAELIVAYSHYHLTGRGWRE